MKKRWRKGYWIVGACGVLIIVLAFNSRALLSAAGRWLDVGGTPQKADAVVLLNGGYNTRPFTAAALVRGSWAPQVLLCTVAPHALEADGVLPSSHEIGVRVLEYAGVHRSEVTLLDRTVPSTDSSVNDLAPRRASAKTTFDEAAAVAEYLTAHPAKRLLLVTEGPHTRRARWIFERVLAGHCPEIYVVSAPTEGFEYAVWWRSKDGFLFVVSEYFKLFFYALRYGWLGYEIAAFVIAALILRACFRRWRKPVSNGSVIY
jgi:uncharacterized SAM-binding protein YcdF (DUF218 family)